MAEALKKVRVQLLDENSGAVIEEVDVLTSANCVTFADGETFQQKLDTGRLTGPKGETGERGPQGPQGAIGATGPKGDKGETGVQGATGAKGDAGSKIHNVTSAPATSLGAIGDWAMNTTNGDVYEKTASTTWTKRGSFKGAKGDPGVQGPQGDRGETGTQGPQGLKGATGTSMRFKGAWSSSTAYVADATYVDIVTSGGNTYRCKTSHTNQPVSNETYWELIVQKGATGDRGAQGPKGDKGDPGDAVKVGTTTDNAVSRKLFFKVIQ